MLKLLKITLLLAFVTVICAVDNDTVSGHHPEPPPDTTTMKPTTVTTPTTSATTKPPTPTTKPPAPPTTKPPTPPPTTTKPPTPPPTTPPTTTKPPPTTTKPTPTTTPAPINPKTGQWDVLNGNSSKACIVVKMAMKIEYSILANETHKTVIALPVNANATGNCSEANQHIKFTWDTDNSVTFKFKQMKDKRFALAEIDVALENAEKNGTISMHHEHNDFITHDSRSYKCDKEQRLNLTSQNNVTVGDVVVSHLQLQAYANNDKNNFDEAVDCEPATTSDVVPIAVGCALVALIIVVLVLYLIGRRRSQARGYLSM